MSRLVDYRRIVWVCAVCIAAVPTCDRTSTAAEPALATSAPSTALRPVDLLMPSTAAYVELAHPGKLLAPALDERTADLFSAVPQLRKALESRQFEQLTAAVRHLEAKLDVKWREALSKLVGGGVAAAFDTSEQALFVFVQSQDEDLLIGLHDELISLIEGEAERKGASSPVKSQEYRGATGWAFAKKEAHVLLGDLLIVSNNADALKRLIDRRATLLETADGAKAGRKKSLADDPTFQAARRHASADDAGFAFVRMAPIRLLTGLAKMFGPAEKSSNFVGELLAGGVLGALETADYVAATLRLDEAGLRLAAHLPHERAKTAAGRTWFFSTKPGNAAAAPLTADGTIATLTAYRDVSGMWMARNELFDEKVNVGLTEADTNLGLYFSGRDFGSQVLGELAPRWRFIAAARTYGDDGEPVPALKLPSFALVWELKNPESFGPHLQMAFQNIIGITNLDGVQKGRPQLLMRTEQRGDAEVLYGTYLLVDGVDRAAGPIHFNFRPACARVGKYFVLGTHVGLVRELADGLAKQDSAVATSDGLALEIHPAELARALEANRSGIVGRQMLAAGGERGAAEAQLDLALQALRRLDAASLRLIDGEQALTLEATLQTAR